MMKRFAILDESGTVLNIVEFELPLKELPWPGYGKYWVCAESGDAPREPASIDARMSFVAGAVQLNMQDRLDVKTMKVERHQSEQTSPAEQPKEELLAVIESVRLSVEAGGLTSVAEVEAALKL